MKTKTRKEAIARIKQAVEHKKEMVARAKEYVGIDIYAKFGNALNLK